MAFQGRVKKAFKLSLAENTLTDKNSRRDNTSNIPNSELDHGADYWFSRERFEGKQKETKYGEDTRSYEQHTRKISKLDSDPFLTNHTVQTEAPIIYQN